MYSIDLISSDNDYFFLQESNIFEVSFSIVFISRNEEITLSDDAVPRAGRTRVCAS